SGYLSLSLGRRAQAERELSGEALERDELTGGITAAEAYAGLSGERSDAPILHLGIGQLERRANPYDPGALLGERLRRAGVATAVVGNSDLPGSRRRYGALLAMDRAGKVPQGSVGGETLLDDPHWPWGRRTDYSATLARVESLL